MGLSQPLYSKHARQLAAARARTLLAVPEDAGLRAAAVEGDDNVLPPSLDEGSGAVVGVAAGEVGAVIGVRRVDGTVVTAVGRPRALQAALHGHRLDPRRRVVRQRAAVAVSHAQRGVH